MKWPRRRRGPGSADHADELAALIPNIQGDDIGAGIHRALLLSAFFLGKASLNDDMPTIESYVRVGLAWLDWADRASQVEQRLGHLERATNDEGTDE